MKNNAYQIVERLFRIYHRSLYYCACRYVGNMEQAKDIVNQVFANLLDSGKEFKDEEEMLDFLFTNTLQVCRRLGHIDDSIENQYYQAETIRELDKPGMLPNERRKMIKR